MKVEFLNCRLTISRYFAYIVLFVSFFVVFSSNLSSAQTIPESIDSIIIESSSGIPVPGKEITIKATSYGIDLNSATVAWFIDGKSAQSGIGLTSIRLVAPALGKTISIVVTAQSPSGAVSSGSYIVSSGSVDMITETNGYVHPLFRGKLAPVYQNTIKITAIPHIGTASGAEYDPQSLVYTWKKNDKVIQDQSGYGKQSITLTGDLVPRPFEISVSVAPRSGGTEVRGSTKIDFRLPKVMFYINDPLYGPLFNSAIGESIRIGSERETSVLAVPFGFNKQIGSIDDLSLTWLINSTKRSELSESESIILRAPEGSTGSSNVSLEIRNNNKILQTAKSVFSTSFNNQDTGSDIFSNQEEVRF